MLKQKKLLYTCPKTLKFPSEFSVYLTSLNLIITQDIIFKPLNL